MNCHTLFFFMRHYDSWLRKSPRHQKPRWFALADVEWLTLRASIQTVNNTETTVDETLAHNAHPSTVGQKQWTTAGLCLTCDTQHGVHIFERVTKLIPFQRKRSVLLFFSRFLLLPHEISHTGSNARNLKLLRPPSCLPPSLVACRGAAAAAVPPPPTSVPPRLSPPTIN